MVYKGILMGEKGKERETESETESIREGREESLTPRSPFPMPCAEFISLHCVLCVFQNRKDSGFKSIGMLSNSALLAILL